MPLKRGRSRHVIEENIHELAHSTTAAGRRRNAEPNAAQINVAIALSKAHYRRKHKK